MLMADDRKRRPGGSKRGLRSFLQSRRSTSPNSQKSSRPSDNDVPQVIINNHPDASAYVVPQLEHEGGKGLLAHKDPK